MEKVWISSLMRYRTIFVDYGIIVCGPRPGEGLFPHLYDGKLGNNEIKRVVMLERGPDGWDDVTAAALADWLVY